MEFLNPWAFLLLFGLLVVFIKNKNLPFKKDVLEKITTKVTFSKKKRFILYLIAYIFVIIALARPIINNGYTTITLPKNNITIILDASAPMKCKDIYPNRFDAAVNKLNKLFKKLNMQNVSVIIVDNSPYLLNPPTNDYDSIIYLLKHINKTYLFTSPFSNINEAINIAKKNIKNPIFLTISYEKAKEGIFYNVGLKPCLNTQPTNKGIKFTYSDTDINIIANKLNKMEKNKQVKILDKVELFYYFLIIAFILIFIASFLPSKRIYK